MLKFTVEEFVVEFGTDEQKEIFIKNKGIIKANPFNSIIKVAKQQYETVMVEGRGKKRTIICDNKYKMIKVHENNYENCGGRVDQLPQDSYGDMASMMLYAISYLNNKDRFVMSKYEWCVNFGFITLSQKGFAECRYGIKTYKNMVQQLINDEIIMLNSESFIIEDYIQTVINPSVDQMMTRLKWLKKAKLIDFGDAFMATTESGDKVEINASDYARVKQAEVDLMNEFNKKKNEKDLFLTSESIKKQPRNSTVIKFKELWAKKIKEVVFAEYEVPERDENGGLIFKDGEQLKTLIQRTGAISVYKQMFIIPTNTHAGMYIFLDKKYGDGSADRLREWITSNEPLNKILINYSELRRDHVIKGATNRQEKKQSKDKNEINQLIFDQFREDIGGAKPIDAMKKYGYYLSALMKIDIETAPFVSSDFMSTLLSNQ